MSTDENDDPRHPSELPDADEVLDDDDHLGEGRKHYHPTDKDGNDLAEKLDIPVSDGGPNPTEADAPPPG